MLLAAADQQTAPAPTHRRGYVQSALIVTAQRASSETYHRVSPNLSGHAIGIAIDAGGFLTPSLALEGEFVFGGAVSAPQRFSYSWSEDYVAENTDLLLNELLRWKPGGTSRFEFIGGGGVATTKARQRSIIETDPFRPGQPTFALPDSTETLYALTLTGGLDAVFPINRAISVAPTFRVRWLHRPEPAARGWLGVSEYVLNLGVGVRAGF
jgi:hypothetical protein